MSQDISSSIGRVRSLTWRDRTNTPSHWRGPAERDKAVSGSVTISGLCVAAFVFAAVSIVGAIVVKLKPNPGGWLLLISGVRILIFISLFGVLPALLLVRAGLIDLCLNLPYSPSQGNKTVLQGSPKGSLFFSDSCSASHMSRTEADSAPWTFGYLIAGGI